MLPADWKNAPMIAGPRARLQCRAPSGLPARNKHRRSESARERCVASRETHERRVRARSGAALSMRRRVSTSAHSPSARREHVLDDSRGREVLLERAAGAQHRQRNSALLRDDLLHRGRVHARPARALPGPLQRRRDRLVRFGTRSRSLRRAPGALRDRARRRANPRARVGSRTAPVVPRDTRPNSASMSSG